MGINVDGAISRRGARTLAVLATGFFLVGAAFAFTPLGKVVAELTAPTAHQYVVGVSGMH